MNIGARVTSDRCVCCLMVYSPPTKGHQIAGLPPQIYAAVRLIIRREESSTFNHQMNCQLSGWFIISYQNHCIIPWELSNIYIFLKTTTLKKVSHFLICSFSQKVNGVCSGLWPILHPSFVEICSVVSVKSCWQTIQYMDTVKNTTSFAEVKIRDT